MGTVTANPMARSGLVVRWADQQATAFVSPQGTPVSAPLPELVVRWADEQASAFVSPQGEAVPSPLPVAAPGDEALLEQFAAELTAEQAAAFDAFKARGGAATYKAAAVKIACEKLGVMPDITAAIDALVGAAGDKSLMVWWDETDQISRGDAQWQEIEAAVTWTAVQPAEVFALAAEV